MENGTTEPTVDKITVKYEKFKKMAAAIEELNLDDNSEISFEFIVGSLFPNVMKNIKKELMYQYTKGYTDGYSEAEELIY